MSRSSTRQYSWSPIVETLSSATGAMPSLSSVFIIIVREKLPNFGALVSRSSEADMPNRCIVSLEFSG